MSNPPNLDRMTKATLSCLDSDDFMQIINKMIAEKEDLQRKISQKVMEVNTWVQVLQTSSVEEANELISMLPETHILSEEETELLLEYKSLSEMATAYSVMDFCSSCLTEEGDMVLDFSSPFPCNSSSKFSLWLNTTENNEYGVKYHNFPDTIPVLEMLQKYIESGKGDVLPKLSTALKQYLWPIFHRENQAKNYEKIDILSQDNFVYHNEDFTLMSFTTIILKNYVSTTYEFVLKYKILEILPYEVKTSPISKIEPSAEHETYVKELAKEMKDKPFWEIITSEISSRKTSSEGSQNSEQTPGSGLFSTFN